MWIILSYTNSSIISNLSLGSFVARQLESMKNENSINNIDAINYHKISSKIFPPYLLSNKIISRIYISFPWRKPGDIMLFKHPIYQDIFYLEFWDLQEIKYFENTHNSNMSRRRCRSRPLPISMILNIILSCVSMDLDHLNDLVGLQLVTYIKKKNGRINILERKIQNSFNNST